MAGVYQLLLVSGGILNEIKEPFNTAASSGFYQTFKGPNKTTIVHRIPVKNGDTRLKGLVLF